jgi:hypothetical protein
LPWRRGYFVLNWKALPVLKLPVVTAICDGRHTSLAIAELRRRSRSRFPTLQRNGCNK